jgi:hypothetical protein
MPPILEPWEPGDLGIPVCAGPAGATLALIICHDGMLPEMAREAAYKGANVILRTAGYTYPIQHSWWITNQANAFSNLAYTASVCLAGPDTTHIWSQGEAMICDVDGTVLCHGDGLPDRIVTGEVVPSRADDARRRWGVENNIYQLGHRFMRIRTVAKEGALVVIDPPPQFLSRRALPDRCLSAALPLAALSSAARKGAPWLVLGASGGLLTSVLLFFLLTGATVFGSGLAILPVLHAGVVTQHHWLTDRQLLDGLSVGLFTPGPVVVAATFLGYQIAGLAGAMVATVGIFAPIYAGVVLPGGSSGTAGTPKCRPSSAARLRRPPVRSPAPSSSSAARQSSTGAARSWPRSRCSSC